MSKNKLNLYKHRFYVFTMDLFSSTKICAKDHSSAQRAENKTPPERGFISMVTGGSRKHTVLRQRQKYTRSLQFAQFKVGFLCHRVWMRGADLSKNTVHPYSIYLYWVCSLCAIRGRKFDRRNEVLAETGGAVSALTPREHTVLRQQRAVTGPRGNAWLSAAHPCRCRRRAGKPFMERTNYRRADAAGDRQG